MEEPSELTEEKKAEIKAKLLKLFEAFQTIHDRAILPRVIEILPEESKSSNDTQPTTQVLPEVIETLSEESTSSYDTQPTAQVMPEVIEILSEESTSSNDLQVAT